MEGENIEPSFDAADTPQREAELNDTAGFGLAGDWHEAAEPEELETTSTTELTSAATSENLADEIDENEAKPDEESTGIDDAEPVEAEVAEPTINQTRFELTEKILREIGLDWVSYCSKDSDERLLLIRELIVNHSSAETIDDEAERIEGLLGNIANDFVNRTNETVKPSRWRQWITGVRTLGLSELGRDISQRVLGRQNKPNNNPGELELSITNARRAHVARTAVTATAISFATTLPGRWASRHLLWWLPGGNIVNAVLSGAGGFMSGQQLSYQTMRRREQNKFFDSTDNSEETQNRRAVAYEQELKQRQDDLSKPERHSDKFWYRLANNRFSDWLNNVNHRVDPSELAHRSVRDLENMVAVLQYQLDQRWVRGDNKMGLIGNKDDWQYDLYVRALTHLAEGNAGLGVALPDVQVQSNQLTAKIHREREIDNMLYRKSKIYGALTGVLAGAIAFLTPFGVRGKADAHETTTPTPIPQPTVPPVEHPTIPTQPELIEYTTPHAITGAIEAHALSALDSNQTTEHLQQIQNAMQAQDDLAFFNLTHHHLADLGYAEHALRAQLIEQLARDQGVTGAAADVWHAADGTVDTSILQHGHGLTGVRLDHDHAVFEHLNQNQLTTAHQEVFGSQSFADWRVDQVTTIAHNEAVHLAAEQHANVTGLREALHDHLTNVVSEHQNDSHFTLTNQLQEPSLRVEARSFVNDWLRDHQHPVTATAATESVSKPTADFLPKFFRPEPATVTTEHPLMETPVLTLADKFTGAQPETPVITEQPTLIDWWQHGPKMTEHAAADHSLAHQLPPTKDLSETSHQAIDSPSHLAEPASTVRGETPVIHEPSLTAHPAAASVLASPNLPEPHHLAVDSSSHLSTPAETIRAATNHQAALKTDNAAALESQIFTRSADAVKPELPAHSLHDYVDTDNKESILIGPNDIGEEIPNEQPSFIAK